MDKQSNKVEIFLLSIHYLGINKRCRKSERHYKSYIKEIPFNNGEYTKEEILEIAKQWMNANVKQIDSYYVRVFLNYVVKSSEGSFSIQQWEPLSKLNKFERFEAELFE